MNASTKQKEAFTPRDTTSFLVMTPTGRISYSADTPEAATRYRDTRHPNWNVVEQTISYKTLSVPAKA